MFDKKRGIQEMFDCAYRPEREPEPAAIPKSAVLSHVWLVAAVVMMAVCAAGVLGTMAADYVMN